MWWWIDKGLGNQRENKGIRIAVSSFFSLGRRGYDLKNCRAVFSSSNSGRRRRGRINSFAHARGNGNNVLWWDYRRLWELKWPLDVKQRGTEVTWKRGFQRRGILNDYHS